MQKTVRFIMVIGQIVQQNVIAIAGTILRDGFH